MNTNNEIKNTIKNLINECVANHRYVILSENENENCWTFEFDTACNDIVYKELFKANGLKRGKMFSAAHKWKKDKYIATVVVFNKK